MVRNSSATRGRYSLGAIGCLLGLSLTSCQHFESITDCDSYCLQVDGCNDKARVCKSPTVRALAQDLDSLERHIDKYGSVVAQHPDVWGQARLTKHRQEFEDQMASELGKFKFSLQGSLARSDQAYFANSFSLSSAASAAQNGGRGSSSALVNNTSVTSPTGGGKGAATDSSGGANSGKGGSGGGSGGGTDQSDTFAAFSNITRTSTGTVTGPSYQFQGGNTLSVEPEVFLNQKARYINHLNELRRINEGDDTADSPGYALNLVRIPVSILPGKCTDVGHGAEVTMTLTPRLGDDLLQTTFRNLVVNDIIDQIAYPVTQFINNPDNMIYLDDRTSSGSSGDLTSDVADLFRFVDDELVNLLPDFEQSDAKPGDSLEESQRKWDLYLAMRAKFVENYAKSYAKLQRLRYQLSLQPLFRLSEWDWVDNVLKLASEVKENLSGVIPPRPTNTLPPPALIPPQSQEEEKIVAKKKEETGRLDLFRVGATRKINRLRQKAIQTITLRSSVLVSATKSRRASLPFPPTQMVEVYGFDFTYQLALEAYRGLAKERFSTPCTDSPHVYFHMPDVQGKLQEELSGVYKLLANPNNCDLWHSFCAEELANAIRSRQADTIRVMRNNFRDALKAKSSANVQESTIALAWATIVESALLTQQLVQDMKESAVAKGCACPHGRWQPYFLPNPPMEARQAFNEYVRCRWPIHVFALDPVTQQQNISDTFSGRREMQLAMSLAFVSGNISASNMMKYARRIEFDAATIDLNNTQVGFSHGDDTFGWRFYPRFQTPDIESNVTVFFRDLWVGGPNRNALLRQRRLEPGQRECVAVVMMPSFVPYADLNVSTNWFSVTNPKRKLMDTDFAMRLSKSVKTIEKCGPGVLDGDCYRDGDLDRLMQKAKQLSVRLPLQSTTVQIPYENTLGGFAMFNTGVTDLAPELTGWYGSPSINPNQPTTVFLVGNHFSVHQTRVVAGGKEIASGLDSSESGTGGSELLSRQVMKVVIPANPIVVGDGSQKFVDVHLATPYGLSQHLLIPVCCPGSLCNAPASAAGGNQPLAKGNAQAPAPGKTQSPASDTSEPPTPDTTPPHAPNTTTPPATGTNQPPPSNAKPGAKMNMKTSSLGTDPMNRDLSSAPHELVPPPKLIDPKLIDLQSADTLLLPPPIPKTETVQRVGGTR